MPLARKKGKVIVLAFLALSILIVACDESIDFTIITGIYRITLKYDSGGTAFTLRIHFNSNGTVTVLTPSSLMGGNSPTTSTWSQNNENITMNFAGPTAAGTTSSQFTGKLQDEGGTQIGLGNWKATFTEGGQSTTFTGTWSGIKE